MSGLFDSFFQNLKKSGDQLEMDKSCYTLYVHYDETDDIDDDIAEPAAFQIPVDMKWKDLQDLILSEGGGPREMNFIYYDDEHDEIRIDSQEEYETALHICRRQKRELHIYKLDPSARPKRKKKKRRKPTEKKKPNDEFAVVPDLDKPVVVPEVSQPPPLEEEQQTRHETREPAESEPSVQSLEGAVGGPELSQDDAILSSIENEETTPMPIGNSLLSLIKKEIHEVVAEELDDIWRFVNALKRDINSELDVVGDQLSAHAARLPKVGVDIPSQSQLGAEAASDVGHSADFELASDAENFAATFICESLLDGSVVHAGETFEKHWVFRNDGNTTWGENTKLRLLEEACSPPVASGSSLAEWGAQSKSVALPCLKRGEKGVVCAVHTAPAHACDYNSSWRMSHESNPFGPRVWCNVRVEEAAGTSVDGHVRNYGSFEELGDELHRKPLRESVKNTEASGSDFDVSLVPADKLEVEEKLPKPEDGLHQDPSVLSFSMEDISDGARHIETPRHESVPYNPAVTSVENHYKEEESLHATIEKKENVGASVDGEDLSTSSASPVLVTSPVEQISPEAERYESEEPRTLENDETSEEEDLYSSKYIENPAPEEDNQIENFTEQVVSTPDTDYSTDGEDRDDGRQQEEPGGRGAEDHEGSASDLHSVEYNLDDDAASMVSYASDFVVVPLPDCFDVNKPLNASQYNENDQKEPETPAGPLLSKDSPLHVDEDQTERYPPEDESDSEVESQPASVTRANDYHSLDSIISSGPKTPLSQVSPAPKVNLAPTFAFTKNDPSNSAESPRPDILDNTVLAERMAKEFDAFLSNPDHPINPPSPKPKVSLNELASAKPKVTVFKPDPKPVPSSVLDMDEPYHIPNAQGTPYFPPFEQGWRRNPAPVPNSVTNNDPSPQPRERPTPAPRLPVQLPRSEFTLNQNYNGIQSTLPSQPFAVASLSDSLQMEDPFQVPPPRRQRSPSPEIEIADDFYPPRLEVAGSNIPDLNQDAEIFRTPPPSPPPVYHPAAQEIELSPLDQLYEMGFHNIGLNKEIFDTCGRDLNRAVQALVLRIQADEEMQT